MRGRDGTCSLCLIGERVLLGFGSQDLIAAQASRRLDFQAGEKAFAAFLMGASFDASVLDEATRQGGFEEFARAAGLSDKEYAGLIETVYDTVAPMFRLLDDERFKTLTGRLISSDDLPGGSARIDSVRGVRTAIATVPSRLRLAQDSLVISMGKTIAVGRVSAVAKFLAHDNASERLAAVFFSSAPAEGPSLVITPKGLARLELSVEYHDDTVSFSNARRGSPDHMSLLRSHDSRAAVELDVLMRRRKVRASMSEPVLGFQFGISKFVSMAHGLLVSGWLIDPDGLVESVTALDHSLAETEVSARWFCFPGKLQTGDNKAVQATRFAAFLPRQEDFSAPHTCTFRVKLSNDESHFVESPRAAQDALGQRAAILDSIAAYAFDVEALRGAYQPALAPLQAEINSRQFVRETFEYGVRSSRRVSIIIPLYKEKGFIRSQLIAFDADPFIRDHCEIVYVLDDPTIALWVENFLSGSVYVYRLDIKFVVLGGNGGYALANNFGVSQADGESLVLMNSDVIPENSGWLAPMLDRLAELPASSVIGPKLLYADESLQHAGMYFLKLDGRQWQNLHYHKGYGRGLPPADTEREVPAVTGALMVLRKADYTAVGGFTSDYVVGDYEDSDLCLKLRAKGGTCLYMPSVALFHFERQSIGDVDDDPGSTVYNRALHTSRWDEAIGDLMARFEGASDAI